MKTIKFRGKRTKYSSWAFGSLITCEDGNAIVVVKARHPWSTTHVEVNPKTIGQFTGLTDRNGREIYEGDILLWTRKNVHIEGRPLQDFSHKCIVYYDNDKCAFQFRCELRCGACVGNLDFDDDRADESYIEIIGNVFDNKDLIEKGWEQ